MTCGSCGSAAEEGKRISFRVLIRDGPRLNLGLGRNGFPGPFSYFLFIFFFLFSVFISIFCKNASNQFKLVSKFFKSSKQPSKPNQKHVCRAKYDFGKSLYSSKGVLLAYMKYGLGFENTPLKIEI
jgi:hypothetical protein